jgi:hypothetical protein
MIKNYACSNLYILNILVCKELSWNWKFSFSEYNEHNFVSYEI